MPAVLSALAGPALTPSDPSGIPCWYGHEGDTRPVPRLPTECPRQPQAVRYRHSDRAQGRPRYLAILPGLVRVRTGPDREARSVLRSRGDPDRGAIVGRHPHPAGTR
jgi:hypothetical protein